MSGTTAERRELAHRAGDGIDVSLYWDSVGDTLTLEVHDAKTDELFVLGVRRDRAMDAFRHPFAYIAAGAPRRIPEPVAA